MLVGYPLISFYILAMLTRVAAAILQQDGKFLVCQRKKGSRYELRWEFPGGKIEPDESVHECVVREVREELSIRINGVDKTEIEISQYDDGKTFEITYCYVSNFAGEPENNVFEQIRWVTPLELRALDILQGNKSIIQRLTTGK